MVEMVIIPVVDGVIASAMWDGLKAVWRRLR